MTRRRSGRIRRDPGNKKRFEETFVRIGNLRVQLSNRRPAASRITVAVQPVASALLGSTRLPCKLAISRSLRSILTDVAADMLNIRDARIARKTPVDREARVARAARVERETTVAHKITAARSVPKIPVVRALWSAGIHHRFSCLGELDPSMKAEKAMMNHRTPKAHRNSAIMSRVAAATDSSQWSGPNWLRYGSRV